MSITKHNIKVLLHRVFKQKLDITTDKRMNMTIYKNDYIDLMVFNSAIGQEINAILLDKKKMETKKYNYFDFDCLTFLNDLKMIAA